MCLPDSSICLIGFALSSRCTFGLLCLTGSAQQLLMPAGVVVLAITAGWVANTRGEHRMTKHAQDRNSTIAQAHILVDLLRGAGFVLICHRRTNFISCCCSSVVELST